MSLKVLGMDIGSYAAKVTVLGGVKGSQAQLLGLGLAKLPMEAVLNWEADPAPAKAAVSQALRNLVKRFRLPAKHVSTSVGGAYIALKRVNLPDTDESAFKTALWSEAEPYLPFPLAEVNVSHHVLARRPDQGGLVVLLAAARKKVIQNRLAALAAARLKPAVIDVDGLALCNAYEFVNPGHRDNVVLADIGANKITVIVLAHGLPVTIKEESGGGQNLTKELGSRFNLSQSQAEAVKFGAEPAPDPGKAAEAVGRAATDWMAAVERVLEAVRRRAATYRPGGLHLSGGGSLIPGLADEFSRHFNIETRIFNPLLAAVHSPGKYDPEYLNHIGPQMAVSFGLALRKPEIQ